MHVLTGAEGQGEMARLQAQAMQASRGGQQPAQACLAALSQRQSSTFDQERCDAELKLAQARALGSGMEFRRWLITYSQLLARKHCCRGYVDVSIAGSKLLSTA